MVLGGRYLLGEPLGSGGFATVYAARHLDLESAHAVKLLHEGLGPRARERILTEGRLQARLQHPNVVRVTDVIALEDALALVMDRVDGSTLRAALEEGPLPRARAWALADGVLAGAAAAHALGLVHRDLKPENVLIDAEGTPRITDFGLARELLDEDPDPALRGAGLGTPGYMAPECYTDAASADARADVFALGAMLYELFSGRRAFPADLPWFQLYQRACNAGYTPLGALDLDLPPALEDALRAALDPDPEGRPADAAALAARVHGEARAPRLPRATTPRPSPRAEPAPTVSLALRPRLPRHNLPAERDDFIGRDRAMEEIDAALAASRLVTLQGIGGAGKTRLACRYGWSRLGRWPGGVWLCDLSEARDVAGICAAMGRALDLPLGRDPVAQLGHALSGRGEALFLLDNLEQVVPLAPETLGHWLDRAAEARFLVTSRERLGLVGERTLPVDPLELQDACALFVSRARAAKPGFEADPSVVSALVDRLDRLPLAIELAASRARLLSPAAMLERMSDRFRLLASPGGRVSRHLTLRAMLDWSWALLTRPEQEALARLSVSAGGLSLEAAEALLEGGEVWASDLVGALVDRSLLRAGPGGRMGMLDAVAEYAAEKLDALGGRAEAERRHGAFFATLGAPAALAALERHGGAARRSALAEELDNLIVACERAAARGDAEIATATLQASWEPLSLRGPFPTGARLAERVLALPLSPQQELRARRVAAHAHQLAGRAQEALAHAQRTLELAQALGDPGLQGRALGRLGALLGGERRVSEARAALERALELHRAAGDASGEALTLGNLGLLSDIQGRPEEALGYYQQAVTLHRAVGNRRAEGDVLSNLGTLHHEQGRPEEARRSYEQALAAHREVGNRRLEGAALDNLGSLLRDHGRLDEAQGHLALSLSLAREVGDRRAEALTRGNLGYLARLQGSFVEARAALEQARVLHQELGARRSEGVILLNLGLLEREEGRLEQAGASLSAALTLLEGTGDRRSEGITRGVLGELRAEEGRLPEGRALHAEAERLLRAAGDPAELARLLCGRARLETRAGGWEAAHAALLEAEALAARARRGPESELGRALIAARRALADRAPPG